MTSVSVWALLKLFEIIIQYSLEIRWNSTKIIDSQASNMNYKKLPLHTITVIFFYTLSIRSGFDFEIQLLLVLIYYETLSKESNRVYNTAHRVSILMRNFKPILFKITIVIVKIYLVGQSEHVYIRIERKPRYNFFPSSRDFRQLCKLCIPSLCILKNYTIFVLCKWH